MPVGVDGSRLEVCADRACATVLQQVDFAGSVSSGTAPTGLSPATHVYFWRMAGRIGTTSWTAFSPTWSFSVRQASSTTNSSWGAQTDLDLDGFADISVGAPGAVAVYLYRGGSAGPSAQVWATLSGAAGSSFGSSVASAGDVNGDGYPELIVGAPGNDSAFLFAGTATGVAGSPLLTLAGVRGSGFGSSVAGAGDLNGDGFADVVIGAPASSTAFVYLGSATGLASTAAVSMSRPSGDFGHVVQGAGDVNADGYGDLVVGWPGGASVALYLGTASGPSPTVSATLSGPPGSNFGIAISPGCDTIGTDNGASDGYTDVAIGSPSSNQVFIYAGGPAGLSALPSATLVPSVVIGACRPSLPVDFGSAVDCVG
ncbi:MAG: VCBS repeat-containing protein, partial [Deltaproteobacteria bacterium]